MIGDAQIAPGAPAGPHADSEEKNDDPEKIQRNDDPEEGYRRQQPVEQDEKRKREQRAHGARGERCEPRSEPERDEMGRVGEDETRGGPRDHAKWSKPLRGLETSLPRESRSLATGSPGTAAPMRASGISRSFPTASICARLDAGTVNTSS